MLFDIYNPSPVPRYDFVVNFVNNLGVNSGSMPEPVSFTAITTSSCSSFTAPSFPPLLLSLAVTFLLVLAVTVTVPSFVNFIALSSRLEITCVRRRLSASTMAVLLFSISCINFTLPFAILFLESSITSSIRSFTLNLSFLSLSVWLSILVTSSISSVS
jgi:hypothetical protein